MENVTKHLFIIWSASTDKKEEIIDDIKSKFKVLRVFRIHWSLRNFMRNLRIFYSHSLKDKSCREERKILLQKMREVGIGDFHLVVFEDNNPQVGTVETTSGLQCVNRNVFELKTKYRNQGCRVHSSNDEWETNKDLTLLLGCNSKNFVEEYPGQSDEVVQLSKDCTGCNGYKSIEDLFYVLNNCIKYVVLRNFEEMPESCTLEGHGDIDLLVENRNYAKRLTGATSIYPQDYRVYHIIRIAKQKVAFDFRYIGDNYYYEEWEKDILSSRRLQKSLFYVPNDKDLYFSLLYHAYIQKQKVKEDYVEKLSQYGKAAGVDAITTKESALRQLNIFFNERGYAFVRPIDESVFYNIRYVNIIFGIRYFQGIDYLTDVKPTLMERATNSGYVYFVGNYNDKNVFIKYGDDSDTCKNEYESAKKLYHADNQHFTPPLLRGEDNERSWLAYEFLRCESFGQYMDKATEKVKKDVGKQLTQIAWALKKSGLVHRDVRPDNIVVVDKNVVLLDYQFATVYGIQEELDYVKQHVNLPLEIGAGKYRWKFYAWEDNHSILQIAEEYSIPIEKNEMPEPTPYPIPIINYWKYFVVGKAAHYKDRIYTILYSKFKNIIA